MKTNLIYTFAIACALAAAGCAHKPGQLTHLPSTAAPVVQDTQPNPFPLPTEGNNPQPTWEEINGMKADRAALAANTIHFAYDSAAIRKAESANIQAVAAALKSDPSTKLMIEGNCDERGTEEYNRALGERRAGAARNALIKLGISGDRVVTKSFGKDKPVGPGHDEASRAQNRRDEFVLLHPANGATPMGGS